MSTGMVLFAVSCFGCTIPHYLFGERLRTANNAFYGGGPTSFGGSADTLSLSVNRFDLSNATGSNSSSSSASFMSLVAAASSNASSMSHLNLCLTLDANLNGTLKEKGCESELLLEQEAHAQITNTVLIMFFVCMLGVGIGMTAVSTLGIPFIDDNVASRESPIYIGKHMSQQ